MNISALSSSLYINSADTSALLDNGVYTCHMRVTIAGVDSYGYSSGQSTVLFGGIVYCILWLCVCGECVCGECECGCGCECVHACITEHVWVCMCVTMCVCMHACVRGEANAELSLYHLAVLSCCGTLALSPFDTSCS